MKALPCFSWGSIYPGMKKLNEILQSTDIMPPKGISDHSFFFFYMKLDLCYKDYRAIYGNLFCFVF